MKNRKLKIWKIQKRTTEKKIQLKFEIITNQFEEEVALWRQIQAELKIQTF